MSRLTLVQAIAEFRRAGLPVDEHYDSLRVKTAMVDHYFGHAQGRILERGIPFILCLVHGAVAADE